MSYSVETISPFDRQFKSLRKKYKSLLTDVGGLVERLEKTPRQGDALGHGCYKVR